jgi:soluble lytic murein transglycosylase-like protein
MSTTLAAAMLFAAVPARAELVFFGTGRTLSVKSHHLDGESLVLTLRGGGEIICDASLIARIAPDEVPYPEPEDARPAGEAAASAARNLLLQADPGRYRQIIDRVSAEQGVPARLVRAVIQVESAYQERARSPKGAMGLMQLMPDTARQYAVSDPYDPTANIEAGIKHLGTLLRKLPTALALAAYNAGEAAVQRFQGIPPYPETQNYVSRILALSGL